MPSRGIKNPPTHINGKPIDPDLRNWMTDIHQAVVRLQGSQVHPRQVTNLRASAQPAAIIIEWTTSNADYYVVYWNDSATFDKTKQFSAGNGAFYVDHIGQANITRWYWVQAFNSNGDSLPAVGPASATSGSVTVGVNPGTTVVQGDQMVTDLITGFPVPRGPIKKGA